MAPSTISRPTITDGVGGTVFNSAWFGTGVYDPIDALFSGNFTVGGIFLAEGFGLHQFNASGTGGQRVNIRNTAAGTGNFSQLALTNDLNRGANLECFSSTWTTATHQVQDGASLAAAGPGGLSLAATESTADLRLYARGSSKTATFDGDGLSFVNGRAGTYLAAGVLADSVTLTDVGNDADTAEKDLHTYTLPANALNGDGNLVYARWSGSLAANTNTKNLRAYFGAQELIQLDTDVNQGVAATWTIEAWIYRTGAATQRAFARAVVTKDANLSSGATYHVQLRTDPTETLSGTVVIKMTGQSGTAAANNIVCEISHAEFKP